MGKQQTLYKPDTDTHPGNAASASAPHRAKPPVDLPYIPQRVESPPRPDGADRFGRRSGEINFVDVDRPFSLRGRLKSFRYAIGGIAIILGTQHSAWLHALATAAVCGAGLYFGITAAQWCWIVLAIMGVWTAEALNTAFELLCDVASPEFHPLVKKAKDASAGAVMISAVGSAIIGLTILGPHLIRLLTSP